MNACRTLPVLAMYVGLLAGVGTGTAQEIVTFDLAGARNLSVSVGDGNYGIRLANVVVNLPKEDDYSVVVEHRVIRLSDLPKPDLLGKAATDTMPDELCADLEALTEELLEAKTEAEVATLATRVRGFHGCNNTAVLADRDRALTQIEVLLPRTYRIHRGEELVVTVTRPAESRNGQGDEESLEWRFVLSGGPSGEWLTTYGLVAVKDNTEKPFLRGLSGESPLFTVDRIDRSGIRTVQAALFTWLPRPSTETAFQFGLVGGFSPTDPGVLAGVHVTYRRNLTFSGGVALLSGERLDDVFAVGDTLRTSLDLDQLADSRMEALLYLGITFNVGTWLFASDDEDSGGMTEDESSE